MLHSPSESVYKMKKKKCKNSLSFATTNLAFKENQKISTLYIPWTQEETLLGNHSSHMESYEYNCEHVILALNHLQQYEDLIDAVVDEIITNGPLSSSWDLLYPEFQLANSDDSNERGHIDEAYTILEPSGYEGLTHNDLFQIPQTATGDPGLSFDTISCILPDDEYRAHIRSLNEEQRQVFQMILDWCWELLQSRTTGTKLKPIQMFITRGAGTGKSHLIEPFFK